MYPSARAYLFVRISSGMVVASTKAWIVGGERKTKEERREAAGPDGGKSAS